MEDRISGWRRLPDPRRDPDVFPLSATPGQVAAPRPDGREFDLLVQGGTVLDPVTGRSGRFDVALSGGRVANVAPGIPSHLAAEVVDAHDAFVVPGLVDLHTHVFSPGTFWGVDPRAVAWRS